MIECFICRLLDCHWSILALTDWSNSHQAALWLVTFDPSESQAHSKLACLVFGKVLQPRNCNAHFLGKSYPVKIGVEMIGWTISKASKWITSQKLDDVHSDRSLQRCLLSSPIVEINETHGNLHKPFLSYTCISMHLLTFLEMEVPFQLPACPSRWNLVY